MLSHLMTLRGIIMIPLQLTAWYSCPENKGHKLHKCWISIQSKQLHGWQIKIKEKHASEATWPWLMTPLLLNRWVFTLVQGGRADDHLQQQQSLRARPKKIIFQRILTSNEHQIVQMITMNKSTQWALAKKIKFTIPYPVITSLGLQGRSCFFWPCLGKKK